MGSLCVYRPTLPPRNSIPRAEDDILLLLLLLTVLKCSRLSDSNACLLTCPYEVSAVFMKMAKFCAHSAMISVPFAPKSSGGAPSE